MCAALPLCVQRPNLCFWPSWLVTCQSCAHSDLAWHCHIRPRHVTLVTSVHPTQGSDMDMQYPHIFQTSFIAFHFPRDVNGILQPGTSPTGTGVETQEEFLQGSQCQLPRRSL